MQVVDAHGAGRAAALRRVPACVRVAMRVPVREGVRVPVPEQVRVLAERQRLRAQDPLRDHRLLFLQLSLPQLLDNTISRLYHAYNICIDIYIYVL